MSLSDEHICKSILSITEKINGEPPMSKGYPEEAKQAGNIYHVSMSIGMNKTNS